MPRFLGRQLLGRQFLGRLASGLASLALAIPALVFAQPPATFSTLSDQYQQSVRPRLSAACLDCHSTSNAQGELDLERFSDLAAIRKDPKPWQQVVEMLATGEMPPKDSPPISKTDRQQILNWTKRYLHAEAIASAGDPGPVVLRRLSNAEYNYTLRDLTGIKNLDPTKEFPVDGAAGEGFTNVGDAQTMSPSLLRKYLDAAKQVSLHAVLLPQPDSPSSGDNALRFSRFRTRRDWTDELLQQIRDLYGRYTESRGPTQTQLPGVTIQDEAIGFLPIHKYLLATLKIRDSKESPKLSIANAAQESNLSEKYLELIWDALHQHDPQSFLLHSLQEKWKTATVENIDALADEIFTAQNVLWKFNPIGHMGRKGSPTRWMDPASTHTDRQQIDHEIVPGKTLISVLSVTGESTEIRLHDPRIVFDDDTPAIPLPELERVSKGTDQLALTELKRIGEYLDALQEFIEQRAQTKPDQTASSLFANIADRRTLRKPVMIGLAELAGVSIVSARQPSGHLSTPIEGAHGHDDINGWQGEGAMCVLTNRSNQPINFLTITAPPRSVTLHPNPNENAIASWQSPINGSFHVSGRVADADDKCGNGYHWQLDQVTESGRTTLASGTQDNGQAQIIEVENHLTCRVGDVISLVISPRERSHACDTTRIELTLSEVSGAHRKWDLANDVVDNILQGNPLADSFGNSDVWHFTKQQSKNEQKVETAPPGSALAKWAKALNAGDNQGLIQSRRDLNHLLNQSDTNSLSEADQLLRDRLLHWRGPLHWLRQVSYESTNSRELRVSPEKPITIEMQRRLSGGKIRLLASATLESQSNPAQITVGHQAPANLSAEKPILVHQQDQTQVQRAIRDYRNLFPPMPCYARIVPVDEVVTLVLFHREDDHLKRLILSSDEIQQLDQLWKELIFVSQEPLQLLVAYEQITAFATQDRPDLVVAFEPYESVVENNAREFRQRQIDAEQFHLLGVLRFADRAWRRPVTDGEQRLLRSLYQSFRKAEISHDQAIRFMIARVLTSPNFLYRQEAQSANNGPNTITRDPVSADPLSADPLNPGQINPGQINSVPITDHELASRLSYFLWSSLPDAELREIADQNSLHEQLRNQTQRMLQDSRTRRLAVEFALQWLHVRLLNQTEKNESLYPTYSKLRESMLEESVRFFEDMFRNNGSILDLLDADHTFLNAELANHYGINGIEGDHWRRVEGMQAAGRGGVLAMGAVLASQSSVSRTSPILRGNWIYETLLGKRLPRPPVNVPQLPTTIPDGLTSRQLIERHSSDQACAKCHRKIDPYGFALEQYDTVGRLRDANVNTSTQLPEGTEINGLAGLRDYLKTSQQDVIVSQFCRKLLGYALGREVQLSDTPLLEEMKRQLAANDYRFEVAVELIVQSHQFQTIRRTRVD